MKRFKAPLALLVCAFMLGPARAAETLSSPCPEFVEISELHSTSWSLTRGAAHAVAWMQRNFGLAGSVLTVPLTIAAAPADTLAMPFRRHAWTVSGTLRGTVRGLKGDPISEVLWSASPARHEYEYRRMGDFSVRTWSQSYLRVCAKDQPCLPGEAEKAEFSLHVEPSGDFRAPFAGAFGPNDYFELYFGPPLNRMIRIARLKDGRIAAQSSVSRGELCELQLRAPGIAQK